MSTNGRMSTLSGVCAWLPSGPSRRPHSERTHWVSWSASLNRRTAASATPPAVIDWCYGFYNHQRRHSAAGGLSPINYETAALTRDAA